jgi:hypothetical protein
VIVNGTKVKPPSYYDVLFEKENPGVFSDIVAQRELDAENNMSDNSVARLHVKETVQLARSGMLKRSL